MKSIYVVLLAVAVAFLQGCYPDPVANFDFNYEDNAAPAQVTFTNLSTDADSYRWDFDDGTTSAEKDPVHTFNQAGQYTISMWAKGRTGEGFVTKTINIIQPTTYIVRNNTSVTLYEVMSYFWTGTEIGPYYKHGTIFGGNQSEEVITEDSPLELYFELADGAMCVTVESYHMVSNTLNYMDFNNDTQYYYEYPAKKSATTSTSAPSYDVIRRIKEYGKVGSLGDIVR